MPYHFDVAERDGRVQLTRHVRYRVPNAAVIAGLVVAALLLVRPIPETPMEWDDPGAYRSFRATVRYHEKVEQRWAEVHAAQRKNALFVLLAVIGAGALIIRWRRKPEVLIAAPGMLSLGDLTTTSLDTDLPAALGEFLDTLPAAQYDRVKTRFHER